MFISDRKFIFVVAVILLLGQILYSRFAWFQGLFWSDMLMHFLGGVLVASIFLIFFQRKLELPSWKENKPVFLLFIVSFAGLIGLFWEFYEYLTVYYFFRLSGFPIFSLTLDDTLSDLFFDLFGGLVAGIIWLRSVKK